MKPWSMRQVLAKINSKSFAYLNYLINIMKKNPNYNVLFEGHTDNVGVEADNQKLSEDRVASVKAYFVNKGIAESKVSTKGFGSSRPKIQKPILLPVVPKTAGFQIFMEL